MVLLRKDVEPPSEDDQQLSAVACGHYIKDEAVAWVHPFWRITASTDASLVNMKLSTMKTSEHAKVPVLINARKISEGEQLIRPGLAASSAADSRAKKKARVA